jgi:hypothetical protein
MKAFAWLFAISFILLPTVSAIGQGSDVSDQKLADLNAEIASLEKQKRTGMYMTGGGAALQLLSLALVPSTTVDEEYPFEVHEGSWAPFYLVLGAGTVVGILGVYKWYDAAQQLGPLKATKYGLEVTPTWDASQKRIGLAFAFHL